ncbi:MAG: EAL domain-containing protein [Thermoanaerobaculia bacterium]|nr:EAL domain-containing protein [Thermoanaerobaculia bacterium]
MRLPGSSIRTKIAAATALLVTAISLFIYFYFPARMFEAARRSLVDEGYSIAKMASISVAPGLESKSQSSVFQALTALRENSGIAYIVVLDDRQQLFAQFNQPLADFHNYKKIEMQARGTADPRNALQTVAGFSSDKEIFQIHTPAGERGSIDGEVFIGLSTRRMFADVDEMRRAVTTVSVAVFAIGMLFVIVVSSAISRPLRGIVETTRRIAAGNLAERAVVDRSTREVAQLARSFNVMIERVEGAQGELASWNKTLENRVEERTRELSEEMTERRRAERRYRALFERNLAGVYIAHLDGRIVSCNDACARMLGYESSEELLAGQGSIQYFDPADRQLMIDQLLERGSIVNHEARLLRRDGDVIWVLETLGVSALDREENPAVEGIVLDITDRKRTEQEVEYQAYHDPLTGLPNRMLFMDRLTVAVSHARRRQQPVGVMFLDLDDLKVVNDTLGHAAGDQILQMIGERLEACLRQEDTVARIGGDEFTVLLPGVDSVADASLVAEKVSEAIKKPFLLGEDEVRVTASIGLAMYPADGEDPETLLATADGTMYRVKAAGGAAFQFSSGSLARRTIGRMTMEESLRHALERKEFVVYYQPQMDSQTREIVAAEALVRWQHPESGFIEPSGFISLAEYTGLIIPIGEWVLGEACRQAKAWEEAGLTRLRIGVNVSARQFHQRDFIGMVQRTLESTRLSPDSLELEITETMAMQKSEWTITMLERLRDTGISIALDDFGTGQSSLTYLKRFPIDTVKIDRSFVSGTKAGVVDAPIIEAVLHLASSLGLRTVAEGIETSEQWDFLAERGCTELQGFHISRPLPADAFTEFLAKSISKTT